jgi:hypothetical protein
MRHRGAPVAQTNGDSSDDDAGGGEGQGPPGPGRSGEAWASPGSGHRRSNGGRGSDDPDAPLAWVSRQGGAGTPADGCGALGCLYKWQEGGPDVYQRTRRLSFLCALLHFSLRSTRSPTLGLSFSLFFALLDLRRTPATACSSISGILNESPAHHACSSLQRRTPR